MNDLRLKCISMRTELSAEAKSLHGEWLGRGGTDESIKDRADLLRRAASLIGDVVHGANFFDD